MNRLPRRPGLRPGICQATLALSLLWNSAPLSAQPAQDAAESEQDAAEPEQEEELVLARDAYAKGVEAYEQRRYKDAIDLFNEANRLTPNPAFSFNIGIAYEEMGDAALALSHYRSYVRLAPQAKDRNEVEKRIERLELKLQSKGVQQVTILSDPAGATIAIDDTPVGITPWTGEIPPGHHQVSLQLRGYYDETRDFDLPPARAIDVPVTLREEDLEMTATSARRDAELEVNSDAPFFSKLSPLSWVLLGAGSASLATSIAFELARSSAESDAREEPVQIKAAPLLDRAERRQTLAVVFGVAGGALLIAGGVTSFFEISSEQQLAASGACTPFGCGLRLSGKF